jgi:DNA repair protein RadC
MNDVYFPPDEEEYPQVVCALVRTELVRERPIAPIRVASSRDVFEYFKKTGYLTARDDKEKFFTLLLDGKNRLMALNLVSVGTLTASLVHPREVFKPAIATGAAALILAHNHPTGDPAPSPEDIEITARLQQAGRIVGIKILDHVILGDGCFASLFERGIISNVD